MHSHKTNFWIMGPTASGKSSLAFKFAKDTGSEIISVDSALVYKGLQIGAAKPSPKERFEVNHHLIDICQPWEIYDVARFCKDAKNISDSLNQANQSVLLSGGTFLYFRSLEFGLSYLPRSDKTLQQKWQKIADKEGAEFLYLQLKKNDKSASEKIHPNDTQRIIRALVVFEQTGKKLSEWLKNKPKRDEQLSHDFRTIKIALLPDKTILKKRIAQRFEKMIENNLVFEVENLLIAFKNQGINENDFFSYPALKSIGYRQVTEYLMGQMSFDKMVETAINATNQLAKRQRTWLRSEKNTQIFEHQNQAYDFMFAQINQQL